MPTAPITTPTSSSSHNDVEQGSTAKGDDGGPTTTSQRKKKIHADTKINSGIHRCYNVTHFLVRKRV